MIAWVHLARVFATYKLKKGSPSVGAAPSMKFFVLRVVVTPVVVS
jgi:hypothetical protein